MSARHSLRILVTSTPTDVSQPLVDGHLHLAAALEEHDAFRLVRTQDLAALDMTADEAWTYAYELMRRTTAPSDIRQTDTDPDVWFVVSGDGLASSRLALLPELVDPMPLGGIIAAVPAHHQLLYVQIDSASALDALQVLASTLSTAVNRTEETVSDQLFWYDGSRWVPVSVHHGDDITVLPPPGFVETMNQVAAMDLVRVAGEA